MVTSRFHVERMGCDEAPFLADFDDRTVFQTTEWMRFIAHTQNAEPVVAAVKDGNRRVGRFSGLVIRRCGVRILGSPFPGWTTSYMGFNLDPSVSRVEALLALERFAFHDLGCVHLEIMDRRLTSSDFDQAKYRYRMGGNFEIDLTGDEGAILAAMSKSSCRYSMRKATKLGVRIEVADDLSFADDYYAQLEDVFAKQSLVPTYPIERVRSLLEHLLPTGNLLLVRARDGRGDCIATGIFPAFNDTMHFWGGASWRKYQHLCPNELLFWFAMRYWKARGIARCDMGGGGEYKRKYGGRRITVPWGRKSKYSFLEDLRNASKTAFAVRQRVLGLKRTSRTALPPPLPQQAGRGPGDHGAHGDLL